MTNKQQTTKERITLETIRETGKVAVDREGDRWQWDKEGNEFRYWVTESDAKGNRLASGILVDATAPGYFTHWANEEDGE